MEEAAAHTEIILAGLLLAIVALVTLARVLSIPYPVFLVVGGLAIGLVPGIPEVRLDPDLVLLIFLPPLLYAAAFFSSLRELKANVGPISLLAVGLVLATCVAVAAVARALVDGLSWAEAFVLGAIVSPTDPVAATAIASRIGVPQRVVTIVEGESLINDATAIVAYKLALAAVLTGSFSLLDAGWTFLYGAVGGMLIGLAAGWVVANVRARLDDPPVEITISILTAYLAYLPAEELGLSGVVAAVTIGLYMGSQTSRVTNPIVRMQGGAVWQILVFLLNSFLFVLVGLQLPGVASGLRGEGYSSGELALYGGAAALAVVVVRIVWTFVFTYGSRPLSRRLRARDPHPNPRSVALVSWMGMRGAVSLAAALALPESVPARDLIVFITFTVILVTLVVQGLTLPAVIRILRVRRDESAAEREEDAARREATEAALARLEQLREHDWTRDASIERMRTALSYRHREFSDHHHAEEEIDAGGVRAGWQRMHAEVIAAQREAIERLRREGRISDDVMRRVEYELDLEELRLAAG